MTDKPEQRARAGIDRLLGAAGWAVQSMSEVNIHAARGVAIREFPLKEGHGFAAYLLYVDGRAAGVVEAKKEGATLTGVEIQSGRYAQGLPDNGRCSRLRAMLMGLQAGLPPLDFGGIRGDAQRRYIAAIQAAMHRDYAPITAVFRSVIARTLRRAAG